MRDVQSGRYRGPLLWCAAAAFLASLLGCLSDPAPVEEEAPTAAETPAVEPRAPRVVVGELAPDFELPRLTFGENEEGEPVGIISENDRFRLSSMFGKRPVCLIMSSFT